MSAPISNYNNGSSSLFDSIVDPVVYRLKYALKAKEKTLWLEIALNEGDVSAAAYFLKNDALCNNYSSRYRLIASDKITLKDKIRLIDIAIDNKHPIDFHIDGSFFYAAIEAGADAQIFQYLIDRGANVTGCIGQRKDTTILHEIDHRFWHKPLSKEAFAVVVKAYTQQGGNLQAEQYEPSYGIASWGSSWSAIENFAIVVSNNSHKNFALVEEYLRILVDHGADLTPKLGRCGDTLMQAAALFPKVFWNQVIKDRDGFYWNYPTHNVEKGIQKAVDRKLITDIPSDREISASMVKIRSKIPCFFGRDPNLSEIVLADFKWVHKNIFMKKHNQQLGLTPLMLAAALGASVEALDILMNDENNVDTLTKDTNPPGLSALDLAFRTGRSHVVEHLILKGADDSRVISELSNATKTMQELVLRTIILRRDSTEGLVSVHISVKDITYIISEYTGDRALSNSSIRDAASRL